MDMFMNLSEPPIDIINQAGQVVPFHSLWQSKGIVLVFVRHFG